MKSPCIALAAQCELQQLAGIHLFTGYGNKDVIADFNVENQKMLVAAGNLSTAELPRLLMVQDTRNLVCEAVASVIIEIMP